jgi:phage/plasmid-associated DNA primase
MHGLEQYLICLHRDLGANLLNDLDGGPTAARVCFVAPMNGWIAHDGQRWRLDSILKNSTVSSFDVEVVGSVVRVDRDPDEPEVFTRNGLPVLNTYVAPRIEPREGGHPGIDRLLSYLADGDAEAVRYLTHWLALKVQEPGRKNMTAIVLQGQQGTGKDTLALIARQMIGPENCARIGQRDLETRFTAPFADKLLVIADEVVNRDNVFDTASPLKQFITDETVRSEEKFAPNLEIPNRMSWIFTSNASVPVRIEGNDDRRYSVFRNMKAPLPEHRQMLSTFYGPEGLADEFLNTEVAGFMWGLVNLDVDEELVRRPYENEARQAVARAGQNSVEAFGEALREQGLEAIFNEISTVPLEAEDEAWVLQGRCRIGLLFELYKEFSTRNRYGIFSLSKFAVELQRAFPALKKIRANGPKRGAADPRRDKAHRPWVYDGLPIATIDAKEGSSKQMATAPREEKCKGSDTPKQAMLEWGRDWMRNNPGREKQVSAAVELEFGVRFPKSAFKTNKLIDQLRGYQATVVAVATNQSESLPTAQVGDSPHSTTKDGATDQRFADLLKE